MRVLILTKRKSSFQAAGPILGERVGGGGPATLSKWKASIREMAEANYTTAVHCITEPWMTSIWGEDCGRGSSHGPAKRKRKEVAPEAVVSVGAGDTSPSYLLCHLTMGYNP